MSNIQIFICFTIGIVIGEALTAPFTGGFDLGSAAGAMYWTGATLMFQGWVGRRQA